VLEIGYLTKGLPTGFYRRNDPVSASRAEQPLVGRVGRQIAYRAAIRVDNGREFISRDLDL